jgi:hypothetical protein
MAREIDDLLEFKDLKTGGTTRDPNITHRTKVAPVDRNEAYSNKK